MLLTKNQLGPRSTMYNKSCYLVLFKIYYSVHNYYTILFKNTLNKYFLYWVIASVIIPAYTTWENLLSDLFESCFVLFYRSPYLSDIIHIMRVRNRRGIGSTKLPLITITTCLTGSRRNFSRYMILYVSRSLRSLLLLNVV